MAKVSAVRLSILQGQASGDILVVLAAQRRHVPFVAAAALEIGGIEGTRFRIGEPVPLAQVDFPDAGIAV